MRAKAAAEGAADAARAETRRSRELMTTADVKASRAEAARSEAEAAARAAEGRQHDAERRAQRRWEQRVAEELDGTLQQTGRGVCRGELDEGRKESEERGLLLLGRDSAERDGTLLEHVDVQAAAGVVRESERVTAARE